MQHGYTNGSILFRMEITTVFKGVIFDSLNPTIPNLFQK